MIDTTNQVKRDKNVTNHLESDYSINEKMMTANYFTDHASYRSS